VALGARARTDEEVHAYQRGCDAGADEHVGAPRVRPAFGVVERSCSRAHVSGACALDRVTVRNGAPAEIPAKSQRNDRCASEHETELETWRETLSVKVGSRSGRGNGRGSGAVWSGGGRWRRRTR